MGACDPILYYIMADSTSEGPWSDELKALVDSSLEKDHFKRPTATQLLATP